MNDGCICLAYEMKGYGLSLSDALSSASIHLSCCDTLYPLLDIVGQVVSLYYKTLWINIYQVMIRHQTPSESAPVYKKIQNYIFKFSDLLGQGNFSKVYKAHHELTNQIVAIKIVELESLKSKKLEELLFSEIDVLKKLSHPNVLKCFEVFTSNRNCYIITELCTEGDLQSRLRKDRYFDEHRATPIIKNVFEGLVYLAEKNVIHRDLKVANVFMQSGQAKIADFGFAKFTKEKFKDINIGSPIYMAPEGFIHNIYGPKTDVWAFGVMIYELLHGETPFSSCRTEQELKQSLSFPIPKSKFRAELSHQIKEVILRCMQIDEGKRITIFQMVNLPYFKRILKKEPLLNNLQINPGIHGSAYDLRMRSPSYNNSDRDSSKYIRSEQINVKRKISTDKMEKKNSEQYTSPFVMKPNIPPTASNAPSAPTQSYQTPPIAMRNALELPREEPSKDRRAMSSQKFYTMQHKQQVKHEYVMPDRPKRGVEKMQILSGDLSFKECVNILHYGRLIFKFLLTLKISEYSNDNELFKLSKWLMELLGEINQKLERKEIVYEGENASLREHKLKEVRNEYEKKYRAQLENYMQTGHSFGEQEYTLEYVKNYCYNLYQKYDSLISKEHNKSLIMLGHCIILMCEAVKLLKRSHDERNYRSFLAYKDIEGFLSLPKEQIDLNSYIGYRKKMLMYT